MDDVEERVRQMRVYSSFNTRQRQSQITMTLASILADEPDSKERYSKLVSNPSFDLNDAQMDACTAEIGKGNAFDAFSMFLSFWRMRKGEETKFEVLIDVLEEMGWMRPVGRIYDMNWEQIDQVCKPASLLTRRGSVIASTPFL